MENVLLASTAASSSFNRFVLAQLGQRYESSGYQTEPETILTNDRSIRSKRIKLHHRESELIQEQEEQLNSDDRLNIEKQSLEHCRSDEYASSLAIKWFVVRMSLRCKFKRCQRAVGSMIARALLARGCNEERVIPTNSCKYSGIPTSLSNPSLSQTCSAPAIRRTPTMSTIVDTARGSDLTLNSSVSSLSQDSSPIIQSNRPVQRKNRSRISDDWNAELQLQAMVGRLNQLLAELQRLPSIETNRSDITDVCAVCLEAQTGIQTFPCKHCAVCCKCFIRTMTQALSQRNFRLRCVICRAKVRKFRFILSSLDSRCSTFLMSSNLVENYVFW